MILQVEEVNDIEVLAGRRELWEELLGRSSGASFFQSLDWLETYWRHHGAAQRLRVLFVSADGQALGVMPLVVRREQTKVGSLRTLTYPLDDWGSFYGPIGPNHATILEAALKHVRQTRRDWDVLDLRWIDSSGADDGQTPAAMRRAGFQAYCSLRGETAVVDLRGDWAGYLDQRGSKWRNNFKRWRRNLDKRGKVTYARYRPGPGADDALELYDTCEAIARKSWQANSPNGTTLCNESVRAFLRDVHAVAARRGRLDVNLLRIDDTPVAFAYNYHYEGYVFGLRIGYDASLSRDGVGNLLYALAIEDSFDRGDRIYDMGPGSLDCKRHLKTRIVPIHRYSHYPLSSPRTQLLRLKRVVESSGIAPGVECV